MIHLSARRINPIVRVRLLQQELRSKILNPTPRLFHRSAPQSAEVEVTIDNVKVKIENGSSIIQACDKAGVVVPRYCYHDKLAIAGNCRMCLVDVEKAPKLVASCAFPVRDGMVVHTNSEKVKNSREGITEFLLENHPLDCPVCDQAGECDLQDQTMRYGSDRSRFHEITGKRAVENKAIGPLIKTSMNRCIHCTRCVRFLNDVAGASEFGTTGRGNDMQIGTYVERNVNSELSGNIIDLCPVGALTSKPYAFKARSWELRKSESIDVLDALGSNIRIDTRGVEVLRVLPRLNDDVNEEWISDKTRFACDGLKNQRLTTPLVRVGNDFEPATWDEALALIASNFEKIQPKGNEIKAIAGALTDVESMIVLKDIVNKLGSENLATDDLNRISEPGAYGVDIRSNFEFNSSINGIDRADQILLIGTNPRHEAAVLNARIRQRWLNSNLEIHHIGEEFESTYELNHLGTSFSALKTALQGKLGEKLAKASNPMFIIGNNVLNSSDAKHIFQTVGSFIFKNIDTFINDNWNGLNVLHSEASRSGALEVGFFNKSPDASKVKPKFLYLLGADDVSSKEIPSDAFVVYQGHHGDKGASYANLVLPGSAYTEKTATYVNTEGRIQSTRAATNPPGAAREDWQILRALADYLPNVQLAYDDLYSLKLRIKEISPSLVYQDILEPTSPDIAKLGISNWLHLDVSSKITDEPLKNKIENFWMTDVISRSSVTMAKCVQSFGGKIEKLKDEAKSIANAA